MFERCNAKLLFLFCSFFFFLRQSFSFYFWAQDSKATFFWSLPSTNNFVNASMWWWTMVTFRSFFRSFWKSKIFASKRKCAICMLCKTMWARTITYSSAMSGVSHLWITSRSMRKVCTERKCIWHNKMCVHLWYAGYFHLAGVLPTKQ